MTSPGGWEQSYPEDSHKELPLGSKYESLRLVSLQQAPSPDLPFHPGTSWLLVRHHDSLVLLSQPLGVESLPSGICTLGAIDAAFGGPSPPMAMCKTCVAGKGPLTLQGSSQSHCHSKQISKFSLESPGGSMELIRPKPQLSMPQG